jgi:hypothetical protein
MSAPRAASRHGREALLRSREVRFELTNRVSHPSSLVLETMIERMEAIAAFLPNVDSIETLEREDLDGDRVRIVRRWQGSLAGAPAALRPFLSRDLTAWLDTALWTRSRHRVEWEHSMVSASIARLYECHGVNTFAPDPGAPETATRILISGELRVRPEALPGIPSFLARTLAPQIERFVVGMVSPNLGDLAAGLQRYFDSQH